LLLLILVVATPRASSGQTAIQYVYDELGRLIAVVDPSGDAAVYTYDAVGNVLSIDRYASSQVSVISFSPGIGPIGTTVAIQGTGFSATANESTVEFNGTAATISSATPTELVVTVPSGATTGPIEVTRPSGSDTSSTDFTITSPTGPTISTSTPTIRSRVPASRSRDRPRSHAKPRSEALQHHTCRITAAVEHGVDDHGWAVRVRTLR
jgi:YD repeat-containing protein